MNGARISFVNTRVRFQRMSDAKLFGGWVKSLTPKHAMISVPRPIPVETGQQFRFEAVGKGADAVFKGTIESTGRTMLVVAVDETIKILPSSEDPRVQVSSQATVELLDPASSEPIDALLLDVSRFGLGLKTFFKLEAGSSVRVRAAAFRTELIAEAEVRYCREEESGYRVGVRILQMDRVSGCLLDRLLHGEAAAA